MHEYISRKMANEACRECVRAYPSSFYNGIEAARYAIIRLPAADVAPVRHGRWNVYSAKDCLYICSECNCLPRDRTRYCPNCGALMDKDGDGE